MGGQKQRPNREEMGKERLPKIAIIYAVGNIERGFSTGENMGSNTICEAIRRATRDKDVKAIILRINSPGGDAVASESIWWEVLRAKDHGVRVVASMADFAASGGYYIAAAADKIVALPGTITGSIGVIGGKFVVGDFLENKLGITHDVVSRGQKAEINSLLRNFSAEERVLMNQIMDSLYMDFISRVALGRNLPVAQVQQIAKGRVWTGADAKANGLVDELGGLHKALEVTKGLLPALGEGADYLVEVYHPRPAVQELVAAMQDPHSQDTDDRGKSGWVPSFMGGDINYNYNNYNNINNLNYYKLLFLLKCIEWAKSVEILAPYGAQWENSILKEAAMMSRTSAGMMRTGNEAEIVKVAEEVGLATTIGGSGTRSSLYAIGGGPGCMHRGIHLRMELDLGMGMGMGMGMGARAAHDIEEELKRAVR